MTIEDLLINFDEMGFAPTTLCENPDEYACEWRSQLVAEIERLNTNISQAQDQILETAQRNQEYREQQVKQAKFDVLNELKQKYGFYSCYSCGHDVKSLNEIIDELLEV